MTVKYLIKAVTVEKLAAELRSWMWLTPSGHTAVTQFEKRPAVFMLLIASLVLPFICISRNAV